MCMLTILRSKYKKNWSATLPITEFKFSAPDVGNNVEAGKGIERDISALMVVKAQPNQATAQLLHDLAALDILPGTAV